MDGIIGSFKKAVGLEEKEKEKEKEPGTTIQFQIQYYGTKGDESFDIDLFGKKMNFKDIGTAQSNLVRRITGPVDRLKLTFTTAGGRSDYKCWTVPDSRYCRSSRRWWGKTRRRCGGRAPYKKCSGENWTRSVVIKKLLINGVDVKNLLYRAVTSCNPTSGNVTKQYENLGGKINVAGEYFINKSDISKIATGEFVPKPDYDKVASELDTSQLAYKSSASNLSILRDKHGDLTNKYNALLGRYGTSGNILKTQHNKIKKKQILVDAATSSALTKEGKAIDFQEQLYGQEKILFDAAINHGNEQARRFANTEVENTNIHKENKDRSLTNDTFKKKTYYEQETTTKFNYYNYIMFYIYMFLVCSTIVIFLVKDSNDFDKFQKNIWYSITFFLLIFLFPFYIYKFEIKIINIFKYLYAVFTTSVYNESTI